MLTSLCPRLVAVHEPVVVGIPVVGIVPQKDLHAVYEAVSVGVRVVWVCSDLIFIACGEAVTVRVILIRGDGGAWMGLVATSPSGTVVLAVNWPWIVRIKDVFTICIGVCGVGSPNVFIQVVIGSGELRV